MDDCRFKSPCTIYCAGPSGCGKTTLLLRMIEEWDKVFDQKPTKIYICYAHEQPAYDKIIDIAPCPVELIKSLPNDLVIEPHSLLVIDDLMSECSKEIKDWHIRKAHHNQTITLTLSQNLFEKGKDHRTTTLNAHYIILFKNPRDNSQITHFAKQFSPGETRFVVSSFHDATRAPHSYLLFDLKQSTNNLFRVRSSVFPHECRVYIPNSTSVKPHNGIESCAESTARATTVGNIKNEASSSDSKVRKSRSNRSY